MFSLCYVTTPTMEVAREISRHLVSNKTAACVNIIPTVTSIFQWEGQLNEEQECLLLIKTQTALVERVIAEVKAKHPYEVPEVISVAMGHGSESYLKWLTESTAIK
ncbi:Divalent ion tolerance protein [Trypanosoma melophagium]|uniref:Divalent ion tolerance protein n=1 Tax=Trypanosoma melophagium TaxID=715481 RepID=UPI00351A76BC|nr:Divalent ion tolerance protein [Trypanosoma melophagium]